MLHITPGERLALEALAKNEPISEIALILGVGVPDAEACLRSLFLRMGVTCQIDAVAEAFRRGLLERKDESARVDSRETVGTIRRG